MNNNKDKILKFNFIKQIILFDAGIFLLALFVSLLLGFSIWVILSLLGLTIGGIGAFLSGPGGLNYDPNSRIGLLNEYQSKLVDDFNARIAPHYGFENAMMFSGMVAFIFSIPFLWVIMFSN